MARRRNIVTHTLDPRYEPPYVHDADDTDEDILRETGYDPETYEIQHCAHCDRTPGRHPSCLIVKKAATPGAA